MTGLTTVIYENEAAEPDECDLAEYRRQAGRQLAGVENIEGSYPFTLANSVKAYRLNRFLHCMIEPAYRAQFLADPEPLFVEHELTAEERDMVRQRDWRGMIHYGVIFFMLEKLGAVTGVSNLHIYAAMRGESLEDFQKTRNAPGALYSVAVAAPDETPSWEKAEGPK